MYFKRIHNFSSDPDVFIFLQLVYAKYETIVYGIDKNGMIYNFMPSEIQFLKDHEVVALRLSGFQITRL